MQCHTGKAQELFSDVTLTREHEIFTVHFLLEKALH